MSTRQLMSSSWTREVQDAVIHGVWFRYTDGLFTTKVEVLQYDFVVAEAAFNDWDHNGIRWWILEMIAEHNLIKPSRRNNTNV